MIKRLDAITIPLHISFFLRPKRTLNSKKYGVDLIHFTHSLTTAVHSSTKIDGEFLYVISLERWLELRSYIYIYNK